MPRNLYVYAYSLFIVMFLAVHHAGAQTCTVINMQDTVHTCPNNTVHISATLTVPSGYNVLDTLWQPATGISDTNTLTPAITIGSSPAMYKLTIKTLTAQNLVYNGDFSLGNTGFTSDYKYATGPGSLVPEGLYTVTDNPINVHPSFVSMGDHTTGTGQMMVINGAATPISVWCQRISVQPNTYYDFSAWGASVSPNSPAVLQFAINDSLVGSSLSLPGTTDLWVEFHVVWYSDTDTSIQICITDQQTAAGGNDFAIDDITFRQICNSTDSVYVAINNVKDSISLNETRCAAGKVMLSAHNLPASDTATQYYWQLGDGDTASGANVNHTYASQGNYPVQLIAKSAAGCADTLTSNILVNNFVAPVTASNDTSVCPGDSATLSVQQGLSYHWSPAAGLSNDTIQQPRVSPVTTTTYYVTVHLDSLCTGTDSVIVAVYTQPDIKAAYDGSEVSCLNPTVQLHATGGVSYIWSPGRLCNDSTSADPMVSPGLANIMFTVVGTDEHTCSAADSVLVDVQDIANVFMPSSFTPNNDGKNDIITPISYCGFQLQLFEIYNRWGQLIFISNAQKTGWDGTQFGVPCPIGTYYYQVEGQSLQGRLVKKKGDITLIR